MWGRNGLLVSANAGVGYGLWAGAWAFWSLLLVLLLCGDLSRLCRPFSCLLCSSRPCTLVCLSETGINRALLDHPGGRSPVPKMRNRRVREDRHAVSPHENNGICGLKGFRKQNENIDLSHYSLTGVTPERCLQPVGLGLLWGVGGVGGGGQVQPSLSCLRPACWDFQKGKVYAPHFLGCSPYCQGPWV